MISVWIGYTTSRSIHQQMDTYRIGITKSSESTHHMLIEDVLDKTIDLKLIEDWFICSGFTINTDKLPSRVLPINATGLLVSKNNKGVLTNDEITEYVKKYLVILDPELNTEGYEDILTEDFFNQFRNVLSLAFCIDYESYYKMFEGGSESITKDTIDIMVDLALSLDEDRYGKLHRLKRMLPEGFLQRRIMHCNYKVLRTMLWQRFPDQFKVWQEWCRQVILQVEHPEFFEDIMQKFNTNIDELREGKCNGKPYGLNHD